jgi:hypothetical protein
VADRRLGEARESIPLTRKSTSLPASAKNGESLGLLLPFITTTATMVPSGEILMPSGVWPTVTVLTTRGGCALRSMRLTVSASPPPRPMFATAAKAPFDAMSIP